MTDFATTDAVIKLMDRIREILSPSPLVRGDITGLVTLVVSRATVREVQRYLEDCVEYEFTSAKIAAQLMLAINQAPQVARDFLSEDVITPQRRWVVVSVDLSTGVASTGEGPWTDIDEANATLRAFNASSGYRAWLVELTN